MFFKLSWIGIQINCKFLHHKELIFQLHLQTVQLRLNYGSFLQIEEQFFQFPMSIHPEPENTNGSSSFHLQRPSAKKRVIMGGSALAVTLGLLCGLGIFKTMQTRKAIQAEKKFRVPPATVTSITTHREEWTPTLNAVGTLQAVNGVTVCADSPGIVESIHFASGTEVQQGDLLVKLDTRQEEAQLIASRAKRELATKNLKRAEELYLKNITAHSAYDTAIADFQEKEGHVKEIETQIARKTIRAPFSGLLGIRQVNIGQYLQSGDKIVPLQSLDPIYVDFSLPQTDLAKLQASKNVLIDPQGLGDRPYAGTITALNSVVDVSTANLKVQATVSNSTGLLRPGMFVRVEAQLKEKQNVITVPNSAISYAPYGDSIFVIKSVKKDDGTPYLEVEQRFVKLGVMRGDRVVVESGLDVGEEVATSRIFGLRPGSSVQVNNTIQPSNQLNPQPKDS